jgi:hypothetical protein
LGGESVVLYVLIYITSFNVSYVDPRQMDVEDGNNVADGMDEQREKSSRFLVCSLLCIATHDKPEDCEARNTMLLPGLIQIETAKLMGPTSFLLRIAMYDEGLRVPGHYAAIELV